MALYQSSAEKNSLLLKFLIVATLVFVIVTAVLYFKQSAPVAVVEETPISNTRFSSLAGLPDTIKEYSAGAQIIHDIESYEEIQNLFFTREFDFSEEAISSRLSMLRAELNTADEFAKNHVYSTSYYTGNLLVRGNQTLHELLLQETRPNTAVLLETALADVRSGALKLQSHFDQMTPLQRDVSLPSALYFITPSFPSLTVSEAATVLYLLAELDPVNARHYERSLHQYVNQVLVSGAHFRIDIEYALDLASVYYKIINEHPQYVSLREQAKKEWLSSEEVLVTAQIVEPRFIVDNFPAQTSFTVEQTLAGYEPRVTEEAISGDLFLTLVDTRLPNPAPRLYHYSLAGNRLLPHGVDLVSRDYPALEAFSAAADYKTVEEYTFVTGDQFTVTGLEPFTINSSRIVTRKGNTLERIIGEPGDGVVRLSPEVSKNTGQLLYMTTATATPEVSMLQFNGGGVKDFSVTDATSPQYVLDESYVVFLRDQAIWGVSSRGVGEPQRIFELGDLVGLPGSGVGLSYAQDANILIAHSTFVDPVTAVPKSLIKLFAVSMAEEKPMLREVASYTVTDFGVQSALLSPGGRYLALAGTLQLSQVSPKVLIFDIISGIVQKDISLSPFTPQVLHLDEWSLFN